MRPCAARSFGCVALVLEIVDFAMTLLQISVDVLECTRHA